VTVSVDHRFVTFDGHVIGVQPMGRPRIGETVMTPAERQRRRRAKRAETSIPSTSSPT